jgi:hypothetical protein
MNAASDARTGLDDTFSVFIAVASCAQFAQI